MRKSQYTRTIVYSSSYANHHLNVFRNTFKSVGIEKSADKAKIPVIDLHHGDTPGGKIPQCVQVLYRSHDMDTIQQALKHTALECQYTFWLTHNTMYGSVNSMCGLDN